MSIEAWKKDIESYIPTLINSEVNEDRAILLNALISLRSYFCSVDGTSIESEYKTSQIKEHTFTDASNDFIYDSMTEEINDSHKYYEKFIETGNKEYKTLALSELKHFEILAKIAKAEGKIYDIEDLKNRHNQLLAELT